VDSPLFDPIEFGRLALLRWRVVAISMGAAVLASAAISFVVPKRYTATASLIIDLPAASDPRAAGALSPVYLESLRTYEHFASSDTIFLEAIRHLGIRSSAPVESMKSSVLRISKPANTRILEISATLKDPAAAQRLAQYLAQKTVELNRSLAERSSHDVLDGAEAALKSAAERLQRAERQQDEFSRMRQPEILRGEIQNLSDLRFDLARDLQRSDAQLQEVKGRADDDSKPEMAGLQARISSLEQRDRLLAGEVANESATFAALREKRDNLDAETESARKEVDAARHRLDEVRASAPYQGERLSVLDPGIVPERPSFPNVALNVAIAVLLSAAGSLFWIAIRYGSRRALPVREHARGVYSIAE
jgi:uncharacterized protein involved in exopolysaccharide biosynthesis